MNPRLKTLNGETSSVTCFYVQLYSKSSLKFYRTAVLAKVDKYAEIEYSMVSSPAISNSSITLKLKVKENYHYVFRTSKNMVEKCHCGIFSSLFRANFTTLGSIRNLLSLLQPFLFHLRTATCCTWPCLLSPPTLQDLCTTRLEPSACTSLTTW